MAGAVGGRVRLLAAGAAAVLALCALLLLPGGAFAQGTDSSAVRTSVQSSIDRTDPQATGLSEPLARTAYRTAMQGAITQSGARPTVVQAGLSGVVCRARDDKARNACNAELASLLQQVVQLAEADLKNGDVAAIRNALAAAVAALTSPPGTTGGGGGGGVNYR